MSIGVINTNGYNLGQNSDNDHRSFVSSYVYDQWAICVSHLSFVPGAHFLSLFTVLTKQQSSTSTLALCLLWYTRNHAPCTLTLSRFFGVQWTPSDFFWWYVCCFMRLWDKLLGNPPPICSQCTCYVATIMVQ